ncbi:hypothetical protein [Phnomibacter sp. MR]|uniref:hypothetical protein n=1 Tax=Phnomibacter sp. MR TaxID=3042318 RepID=UPI003A7F7FE5
MKKSVKDRMNLKRVYFFLPDKSALLITMEMMAERTKTTTISIWCSKISQGNSIKKKSLKAG